MVGIGVFLAAACGSDDDGAGDADAGVDAGRDAPRVIQTVPADGARQVSPDTAIELSFSEELDPSTVSGASVEVTTASGPVSGTVRYLVGLRTITFTPDEDLRLHATYQITATDEITGSSGGALDETSFDFTVRRGRWTGEHRVSPDPISPSVVAGNPAIAIDGAGNPVAVWVEESADTLVMGSHRVGGVWSEATPLITPLGSPPLRIDLAINQAGFGYVLINVDNATLLLVPVSPEGFGTLQGASLSSSWHRATVDGVGNGWLAMVYSGNVRVARWPLLEQVSFNPDTQLDTIDTSSSDGPSSGAPEIAANEAGDVAVVWHRADGGQAQVWANVYTSGGWQTATRLDGGAQPTSDAQVAIDAEGNATAVWLEDDGEIHAFGSHFSPGSGWSDAIELDTATTGVNGSHVRVAAGAGTAVAVWSEDAGEEVWANRFVGEEWLGAADLDARGGTPEVVVDGGGVATVLTSGLEVVRSGPDGEWSAPAATTSSLPESSGLQQLAGNSRGECAAIWNASSAPTFVLANLFR